MTYNTTIWRKAIAIFLLVAGVFTATLNAWNAEFFTLQNASVAMLVERGTFALADQITPKFHLVEGQETFRFGASVYPMKQPGQTILGAVVYLPLYRLGSTFYTNFHYTSHLITLFTSTLMMAIIAALLFLLVHDLTKQSRVAMLVSFIFAFGTIIWPYAGVSHHDIYGTFWGVLAFGSYYVARRHKKSRFYLLSGAFSTLTLFFTMLPLSMPVVLWGVTLIEKRYLDLKKLTIGMIIGLLPTFVFNYLTFGNPWLPPNLAGGVADTMPLMSLTNILEKLSFYLASPQTSLLAFMPVLVFSVLGIFLIPKQELWLKRLLIFLPLAQLLHISTMETFGGWQYGPRYLLPVLPYLVLSMTYWIKQKHHIVLSLLFGLMAMYSVGVAFIGAIRTVMYELPGPYAPFLFIREMTMREGPTFRMLVPGIILILASFVCFYIAHTKEVRVKAKK